MYLTPFFLKKKKKTQLKLQKNIYIYPTENFGL